MKWLEIAVSSPPELVEVVANAFEEMGSGGVVIEDPALTVALLDQGNIETIAPSLKHPTKTDEVVIKGYLNADCCSVSDGMESLSHRLAKLPVRWQTKEVWEQDWATAWQQYYKPVRVGKHLVVCPSWENYTAVDGEIILELDPGMAFGCGTHATTSMCLELLEEYITPEALVYDVGAGTGILSIAAALLGASLVYAVDNDPVAVRTAQENAERNRVAERIAVFRGHLLNNASGGRADLITANIIADVIIDLAPSAYKSLKQGGRLIASGIILERLPEVRKALEKAGLIYEKELTEGEWVALVFRKEA